MKEKWCGDHVAVMAMVAVMVGGCDKGDVSFAKMYVTTVTRMTVIMPFISTKSLLSAGLG